ncbi:MarR family transcriptional regulator [Miltoncostaea oceani]|uniref:MarR family transcriptional regulator n=1 Tax=Miltoncostaea oceani TaxID=2843216 RepID=UPI001C3CD9F1|nr:MarR family transcriptional regulator [Miltoncostaea oceani]
MNTFVLLGLAAALALFLLRSKRRRAGGDADPTPSPARPGRGIGRRRRAAAPEPVAADHVTSPFASPAPFAPPASGGFGAVETFTPAEPVRSPFPATPAPTDWAPAETIVEPGWPLPGEIAGTWTGGPESSPAPVATVEAPVAHAETAATATHAPPRSSDSWEMPALTPVDPITPQAHPVGDEPSGPPAWIPGAVDATPAWPAAEDAPPAWDPGADAPPPAPDAPAVQWSHADAVPAAGEPVPPEPAAELPLWRPEPPPAPADHAPPADAPAVDLPAAQAAETLPAPDPAPAWDAPAAPEPAGIVEPAPLPEWNAPPPEPALAPASPVADAAPAWEPPAPDPVAPAPFVEAEPAWVPPPAPVLAEPAPVVVDPSPAVAAPAPAADLGAQSAEVAELVPAVLSALRPLVRVSDHVGITPRMLVVVRHLAAAPLSVGELATLLGVSRPVVADIAARLESAGLTRRERDESDRRRVRLVLTGRGRRVHDEAADAPPADAVAGALGRMEPADREALVRGLRALSRSASA